MKIHQLIITPVALNFSTISQSGTSSVSELNSAPDIPSNFTIGEPVALLEINTTSCKDPYVKG